jgi:hypothetical protein
MVARWGKGGGLSTTGLLLAFVAVRGSRGQSAWLYFFGEIPAAPPDVARMQAASPASESQAKLGAAGIREIAVQAKHAPDSAAAGIASFPELGWAASSRLLAYFDSS